MGYEHVRAVSGRARTLEILDLLALQSPRNYSALEAELDTSSATLSECLDLLVQYELLRRDKLSHKDVRYAITDDGRTVLEHCRRLDEFLSVRA